VFEVRGAILVSGWLYRALLHLYPQEFRLAYSRQMRLTFGDACRAAYARYGVAGLAGFWLPTLLDLFKSALEERARGGEIGMSKERWITLAGPLTILVGSLWLAASIGEMAILVEPANADTFWDVFWIFPVLLSFIPLLFALIGTRLRFYPSAGLPGRLGLALSAAGCAGLLGFVLMSILLGVIAPEVEQVTWPDYVIAACFLILMLGYILFGVDALRYKLLPRWNLLPILLGAAVVFRIAPDWLGLSSYHPLLLAFYALHFALTGACWVLLGIALLERSQEPQPTAAF
jgi:hypothetical protein